MKVVFLDIDGVLQPFNSRERFKYINTNSSNENLNGS